MIAIPTGVECSRTLPKDIGVVDAGLAEIVVVVVTDFHDINMPRSQLSVARSLRCLL